MDRKPRPTVDLAANCACGAVSVHFAGPVKSMFMCSCEDCQKASGGGHSAFVIARAGDVTIAGPLKSHERASNSGATFRRYFCPECGTPIYGQSSRGPEIVSIPVGLFGAQAAAWFEPNQLIFARSHRDWDTIAAELPRYQTYRGEEPA